MTSMLYVRCDRFVGRDVRAEDVAADRIAVAAAGDAAQHAVAREHDLAAEQIQLRRRGEPCEPALRTARLDFRQRCAREKFALVRRDAEAQSRLVGIVVAA